MNYGQILAQGWEIFMMIPEIAFAGLSVMTVADLLELPPVRRELIFSLFSDKDSMKYLLGLQLWHLFKYEKLTKVVRQNDKLFMDLLNKVRNIDDDVENVLKARFIRESDESYSKGTFHMLSENEPAVKKNEAVLNDVPGQLYTIEAYSKIQGNCK